MKSLRTSLFLAVTAITVASCGGSPAPDTLPKAKKVDVAIASVTLADDCGTGPTTIPSEPTASMDSSAKEGPAGRVSSMSQIEGDRACEQSSIQLRVANGTDAASNITIKKVEVVDDGGAVIGELTWRDPSQWDSDSYKAWDEKLAPEQVLQVSYALSAPVLMRGATYTVRVTVAAGDGERTLEQKTTIEAEASLPPDAVT